MIIIYFLDPHRMVLLPCLQRLIFHLIVFRFSHQILQWARSFLVLTYLPKMYMYRYTPDIYIYIYIYCKSLDYRLCVWYYVIPVCCESVWIVLKLYFNLFFHINSISNESLITCIMVFGFHEKNDPFCQGAGHSIQQYRINPFNPSCSYIHQV